MLKLCVRFKLRNGKECSHSNNLFEIRKWLVLKRTFKIYSLELYFVDLMNLVLFTNIHTDRYSRTGYIIIY